MKIHTPAQRDTPDKKKKKKKLKKKKKKKEKSHENKVLEAKNPAMLTNTSGW